MLREAFHGRKVYTAPYPMLGARSSGTAKFVVDLVKQGVVNSIDTLSVHLTGTVTVTGASAGTATGSYNPEGLLVNAQFQTSPQVSQLIQINSVGSRVTVIDRAIQQQAFQLGTSIPNTAGTQTVECWYHFTFKRNTARRGIEYALPMNRWSSATLNLTFGTIDQLFSGSTNTWDMTSTNVEIWVDSDLDVFGSGGPGNIHASEIFELVVPVTATNAALDINNLPQGCFYDMLVFAAEDNGSLSNGIINNIDVEGGGRNWTVQGDSNASYIQQRWTRPLFNDPTAQTNLTGIYALPLRDGLWSRAMDATASPLDIKLNVTKTANPCNVRVFGRKLVPFGIRQTVGQGATKKVIEKTPVLK
jgi:hypothetical protein